MFLNGTLNSDLVYLYHQVLFVELTLAIFSRPLITNAETYALRIFMYQKVQLKAVKAAISHLNHKTN